MGFTAEGGYEEIQVVSCWMSKHGNYYLYLLAALNILLSMIASLGNILILSCSLEGTFTSSSVKTLVPMPYSDRPCWCFFTTSVC